MGGFVFVRATGGQYASLGIGKQVDRQGTRCSVEYFSSPASEPVVHDVEDQLVEQTTIAEQTRVYHFDDAAGDWEIGRLLEDHGDCQLVRFSNGKSKYLKPEQIFVSHAHVVHDPMDFLAKRVNESAVFCHRRSAFIRSQVRQRAACNGMSALLSCAVKLEPHQIEVVQRILQDPVQRYILADEVGLGKTIEAGVLIRQCILDNQKDCIILVIVPESLVSQWTSELASKFFLSHFMNRRDPIVHVVALGGNDDEKIRELIQKTSMLVIDEAHHLTDLAVGGREGIYKDIAYASKRIERVLLLSATPALHNERGFLEMLHLLDAATYPLESEAAFRRKVEGRQELAEIVAGLTPENALYLDYTIDQIVALFPNDEHLLALSASLRAVVETIPAEDDPALVAAIGHIHAHLSEVYRLHRRILRNRRRNLVGLTPDRSGATIIRYRSSDRAALTNVIDDWRFGEAITLDTLGREDLWADRARAFRQVLDRSSQYSTSGAGMLGILARHKTMIGDHERFGLITKCLGREGFFLDRAEALIQAMRPALASEAQCVVFCTDTITADDLAKLIGRTFNLAVDRHDPNGNAWKAFNKRTGPSVLVCDRRAEEGLNLQGGKKIVIHYDIPLNPNRVEQRMGRVDRYGSSEEIRSLILACEDDPIEMAWVAYLDDALRVFNRSIASLQYLIEETVRGITRSLFTDGAEELRDLTKRSVGEQGVIEREIKAIDQQDALDALGVPPTKLVHELLDVDKDWRALASAEVSWLEEALQFERRVEPQSEKMTPYEMAFCYVYSTSGRPTLIPRRLFFSHCKDALEIEWGAGGHSILKTIPYSFSRSSVLNYNSQGNQVCLLRYGDPLMNGLMSLSEKGQDGRSFAFWRSVSGAVSESVAEIYFRFDFVIETDVTETLALVSQNERSQHAARAAIRRRGDIALSPRCRSLWLDRQLRLVTDQAILSLIDPPYGMRRDHHDGLDLDLDGKGWQKLLQFDIPELSHWSELCKKARVVAEAALRSDPSFVDSLAKADQEALRVDVGRIGQLRARANAGASAEGNSDLHLEERLSAALRDGIRAPSVRLDAVGAVFLSANRDATDRMSGVL